MTCGFLIYDMTTPSMIIENIANIFPDSKLIIPKINPNPALTVAILLAVFNRANKAAAILTCIETKIQSQIVSKVDKKPSPASLKKVTMMNGILMIT